jgi:hypothetical protein
MTSPLSWWSTWEFHQSQKLANDTRPCMHTIIQMKRRTDNAIHYIW